MTRTNGRRACAVFSILVLALAVGTATTAWAVEVRGTLRVPTDYGHSAANPDEERRNHYWEEWNGFLDLRPARFDPSREIAVVLTGDGPLAPNQPPIAIANGALSPATIVARVGSEWEIKNTDPVVHQLAAEGLSELGPTPIAPDLPRRQTITQAGHWPLRDEVYGHIRGHLHALPDLVARAVVQPDGSFVFHDVPAGTYTLKVFHGERELHSAQVTVPEDRELVVDPIAIGAAPAQ